VSRALTFWNDETIKLIQQHFVAASVPTWVCKTDSPEGEFLRSADVHKQWVTSSGYMTCLSAGGTMLGHKPCEEVLAAFDELPESDRKPGAIEVPDLPKSEHVIPSPPEGGLVLRVHARFLSRGDDGKLRHAQTTDFPLMRDKPNVSNSWRRFLEPNTEYMWLTRDERQSLVPGDPTAGRTLPVDPAIARRMARFHLTPKRATTSEGGIVRERAVQQAELELHVRDVSPRRIRMDLTGYVHWGTEFDELLAVTPNGPLQMGYATELHGRLEYDRRRREFTRFDVVAPGHVWGRWGDANGKSMYVERPGKAPFGFAVELAGGDTPTDRIPPGGNGRYVQGTGYFAEVD